MFRLDVLKQIQKRFLIGSETSFPLITKSYRGSHPSIAISPIAAQAAWPSALKGRAALRGSARRDAILPIADCLHPRCQSESLPSPLTRGPAGMRAGLSRPSSATHLILLGELSPGKITKTIGILSQKIDK